MSFPWGSLMRSGLGELRLPPAQFWTMTLKELAAATGQEQLDVKSLRRLMEEDKVFAPRERGEEGAPSRK
jgi:uncharacterized phage protein (TIGR02216 family)